MVAIPSDATPQQRALIEAAILKIPEEGIVPGTVPRSWANVEWLSTLSKEEFAAEYRNDMQAVLNAKLTSEELVKVNLEEYLETLRQILRKSPLLNPDEFQKEMEVYKEEYLRLREIFMEKLNSVKVDFSFLGGQCTLAVVGLISDTLALVMSVIGLRGAPKDLKNLFKNFSLVKLSTYKELVPRWNGASTSGKAMIVLEMFNEAQGAFLGGMKGVVSSIWESMDTKDKILLFVAIALQVTAFFASGGLALVAQIGGLLLTSYSLYSSVEAVVDNCNLREHVTKLINDNKII